jgi:glyoxylase-like metal-dependent hydrolase (beta-lactamase superfamily II)
MEIIKIIIGQYQTNCYLVISDNEMAIIDPGADYQKIVEEIEKQKAMNASLNLKYIIITHHHFDHVNAVAEVKQAYGGELLIHKYEKDYIDFAADRFLENGDKIMIGSCQFEILLTPGHTAGSICLISDSAVFTGDTLFIHSYGRTDLAGGSKTEMQKSLALLNSILKSGQTVYPGHGESYLIKTYK